MSPWTRRMREATQGPTTNLSIITARTISNHGLKKRRS